MKRSIAFLVGAGCEGEGQFGLPSGTSFRRDTIIAEGVTNLIYKLNHRITPVIKNGTILKHNSTSVLYQTLREGAKLPFSPGQQRIVDQYEDLKKGGIKNKKDRDVIQEDFNALYRNEIYEKIKNGYTNKLIDEFLKNARFYSFVDALFNHLREPEIYKNEVNRVIKLYYAAYMSMLKSICKHPIAGSLEGNDLTEARAKLAEELDKAQQEIVSNNVNNSELYYNIINKTKHDFSQLDFRIVTTNYTIFAQEMIELQEENIAYIHGKLDLFEDLKSKQVAKLTDFADDDFVFPFIFVQSGIKPVVSGYQIRELEKARKMLIDSDVLIVLGYGINSDDEHITNLLRERLRAGKKIYCFLHTNSICNQERVKRTLLSNNNIDFYCSYTFSEQISKISHDLANTPL